MLLFVTSSSFARLLQYSLQHGCTSIIVSIRPDSPMIYETLSTLKFGERAQGAKTVMWLRRRGYLMVLLLFLGGRATGGTDGTAVLLARLAHLPWDVVEHVFQWL